MKKWSKITGVIASVLMFGAFAACGNNEPIDPEYDGGKAPLHEFQVTASYKGEIEIFKGSISDTSITIDLPANIDSWDNVFLTVKFMNRGSIQLNGTGTSYGSYDAEKITGTSILGITSILSKGFKEGYTTYKDQTYTVTINKKLYVPLVYELYGAGEKISLPSKENTRIHYRQLGWSTSQTAVTPEYALGDEITVTEQMVNAGVLDLYVTWSKYYIGQLVENVTDIDGKKQTGYVAYICGNNDNIKAKSSKPNSNWTYLIVSKYGANRLTDVNWNNATFTDAYLPTKTEMEAIIENLWEDCHVWKIFSDGSVNDTGWTNYWTKTEYDADNTTAYYASATTNSNVTGTYAGFVTSTKDKTDTLKAIGISYIE